MPALLLFLSFSFLSTVDLGLTFVECRCCPEVQEVNPIPSWILRNWGWTGLGVLKVVTTVVVGLVLWKLHRLDSKTCIRLGTAVVLFMSALTVYHVWVLTVIFKVFP